MTPKPRPQTDKGPPASRVRLWRLVEMYVVTIVLGQVILWMGIIENRTAAFAVALGITTVVLYALSDKLIWPIMTPRNKDLVEHLWLALPGGVILAVLGALQPIG